MFEKMQAIEAVFAFMPCKRTYGILAAAPIPNTEEAIMSISYSDAGDNLRHIASPHSHLRASRHAWYRFGSRETR